MRFPIVGNERVKDAVCASIKESRLPHAILIEGEHGTGKRTLARFIADSAACTGSEKPCGLCRGCTLSKAKTHPDITVTTPEDGKKNITVAQIRNLRSEAYVKPHMANGRVFIIEKADSMNDQAQNALLKVLEEPPGNALFILTAESKASLLDTVISRCTVLTLAPPDTSEATEYILSNCDFKEAEVRNAVTDAGGNIGIALNILSGSATTAQTAAADFLTAVLNGDKYKALCMTAAFEKNRNEAALFLKELKLDCAKEIKKSRSTEMQKQMLKLYNSVHSLEESLATNINLSLMFCTLVCTACDRQ